MTVIFKEKQIVDEGRNIIISSTVEWANTYRHGWCYTAAIRTYRTMGDDRYGCVMSVGQPQLDGPTVVLLKPETGRRSKKRDEMAIEMAKGIFPELIAERLSKGLDL